MNREVVKELIQHNLNYENLKTELSLLLEGEKRNQMLSDFNKLRRKLGGVGASEKAAEAVIELLKKQKKP